MLNTLHSARYYGAPTGSCTCPPDQRPTPECPATVKGGGCSPPGGFCFLEPSRTVRAGVRCPPVSVPPPSFVLTSCPRTVRAAQVATPSGLTFDGGPCCGASQNLGDAVFSDLDIRTTASCNSDVAQAMAAGICFGQESCTLLGSPRVNQSWPQPADVDLGAGCNPTTDKIAPGVTSAANNTCKHHTDATWQARSCERARCLIHACVSRRHEQFSCKWQLHVVSSAATADGGECNQSAGAARWVRWRAAR